MAELIETYRDVTLKILDGEEVRVIQNNRTIGVVVERDLWTAVPFGEQKTWESMHRNAAIDYIIECAG